MGQTAEALRTLGASVRIWEDAAPVLTGVDVVHGFGLDLGEIKKCRVHGTAVVLSTIYCGRGYRREGIGRKSWRTAVQRGRVAALLGGAALAGPDRLAKHCQRLDPCDHAVVLAYEAADLLLPNSESEAEAIRDELGVTTPTRVVPNAVRPELADLSSRPCSERTTVLCLGRIEPHKNQLGLIEALDGLELDLEIAGPCHPHHPEYLRHCQRRAGPRVRLLGDLPHGSEGYRQALSRARVHVLPSWFETTGLASLEAGIAGCNVVTTSRGFAGDYFGELAWYCDPARRSSIRKAVLSAWSHPGHPQLRDRILRQFTWAHTGRATLAAYEEALHLARPRCPGRSASGFSSSS